MWNRWNQTKDFKDSKPWLLRFFDQIRFYPVSADELLQMRADFPHGKFQLNIDETRFSLKDYNQFLKQEFASINNFKTKQQAAFDVERERWIASGQANYKQEAEIDAVDTQALEISIGQQVVSSHVAGNLWQINVSEGDVVQEGDVLMIVESMKMEISIIASCSGKISKVLRKAGGAVFAGQNLILIEVEK